MFGVTGTDEQKTPSSANASEPPKPEWQVVVNRRSRWRKNHAKMLTECEHDGCLCDDRPGKLQLLKVMDAEPICKITESGFEEIELAVDSGATETVVGEKMLSSINTKSGRKGVRYETATGDIVENLGQKEFVSVTDDTEMTRSMTAQVAEGVTKDCSVSSKSWKQAIAS